VTKHGQPPFYCSVSALLASSARLILQHVGLMVLITLQTTTAYAVSSDASCSLGLVGNDYSEAQSRVIMEPYKVEGNPLGYFGIKNGKSLLSGTRVNLIL
jgi:hypothetical protein